MGKPSQNVTYQPRQRADKHQLILQQPACRHNCTALTKDTALSGTDSGVGQDGQLGREVSGHECDAVRHRDPGGRETAAFPLLGGRMIDLEIPHPAGQPGPVGE